MNINIKEFPWNIHKNTSNKIQLLIKKSINPNMEYPAYRAILQNKLFYVSTSIQCNNCGKNNGSHFSCYRNIITTCQPNYNPFCVQTNYNYCYSVCMNEYPKDMLFNFYNPLLKKDIIYIGNLIKVNNEMLVSLDDNETFNNNIKKPYRNFIIREI